MTTPGAGARPLTAGEWQALSAGLSARLREVGAAPLVCPRAHPAARIAAVWRGAVPILTRGDAIWWPGAPPDLSLARWPRAMAVLQHELQHVLDFRTGRLTTARYFADPREWIYAYDLADGRGFDARGAEQRASMAEHVWLAERGLAPDLNLERLRAAIPWAAAGQIAEAGSSAVAGHGSR